MDSRDKMINIDKKEDEEIVIDLGRMFREIRKHWLLILILMAVCGLLAFAVSAFVMTEQYESRAQIYLKPQINKETDYVDYSSISANSMMVNNYMGMLKGENLMKNVSAKIGGTYSKTQLKDCITVSNEPETELINIVAVTPDAELSHKIVYTLVDEFSLQMKNDLDVTNILVVDEASVNNVPVSPDKVKNTLLGVIAGLMIALAVVVIRFINDKKLKNQEDAESYLGIPVLAVIPYREV